MNELVRAGFFRRLGAFVIDAVVSFALAVAFFVVWTIRVLGGVPETPAEFAAVFDAGQLVMPGFIVEAWLAYVVASWTPLLGRRSVGMRQLGIRVVQEAP